MALTYASVLINLNERKDVTETITYNKVFQSIAKESVIITYDT